MKCVNFFLKISCIFQFFNVGKRVSFIITGTGSHRSAVFHISCALSIEFYFIQFSFRATSVSEVRAADSSFLFPLFSNSYTLRLRAFI